jgi:protoporphyrinogen oxidase
MTTEQRDAIVVGGNIAGLTIANLLGHYGYKTTLVERGRSLGGMDASFTNEHGRIFDFGVHALDHNRSEFVSRMFERAVDGRFRRLAKKRAILVRNHLIAYNTPPEGWPAELRAMLKPGRIVDDLGSDSPTRERLGEIYGQAYANFIFDEVLPSYPAEIAQRAFGVDDSKLLVNIYPWFFPKVERRGRDDNAHFKYQTKVRDVGGEYVIYPETGGFAGFANGIAEKARKAGVDIETGATDLEVKLDSTRRYVRSVRANGRILNAPRVYWCGPASVLMQLLGEPAFNATPETFALGSLQFERPLNCEYIEMICGDPEHLIKRASFPGKLQGTTDDTIQIEFYFPKGDTRYGTDKQWWEESWIQSLRRIGIAKPDNKVLDLDLKLFPIHYNSYGIEGKPTPRVVLPEIPADSNLRPVLPSYQRININTRLPLYLKFLADDLTRN